MCVYICVYMPASSLLNPELSGKEDREFLTEVSDLDPMLLLFLYSKEIPLGQYKLHAFLDETVSWVHYVHGALSVAEIEL